jgi:hypothetical protein
VIPFARTVCACRADVANCYRQPGYLGVEDLTALPLALGARELPATFFRRGQAVLGNAATGETLAIPTIVPARRRGRCVFLMPDERCLIHPAAPFGCAYFDVHQSQVEANRRSLWMLRRIVVDAAYADVAARLDPKEVDAT